ncbi:MAG: UDP-3-O-(3-hydroxymyristoyl)glucosamine N-acyltransferase [Deltaproteobacteria bacterium]|nr:UDP-3-O-(3-hydroxymyristoyl)glucosamine N-acyltransferase [Deltaproteobacteria bacterium]
MTLAEVARAVDGELVGGNAGQRVYRVAPLATAGPGELTFFYDRKLARLLASSAAEVVVVGKRMPACPRPQIVVARPDLAVIKILRLLYPEKKYPPGRAATAVVAASAEIAADAFLGPGVCVGERTVVGAGAALLPGVVLGDDVVVGAGTVIHPNVVVYDGCRIGARCLIHAGTVIGSDGYAFTWDGRRHCKIPQVGIVEIGDDVEIGANNTIDRAALAVTRIGNGVKTDNLVQIAHNVQIGDHSLVVAQVGIAGSATIGRNVILAGQVGVAGHLSIGDGAIVGPQTGVTRSIGPGEVITGTPQMPHREFLKAAAVFTKLPAMRQTLQRLEKEIEQLRSQLKGEKDGE